MKRFMVLLMAVILSLVGVNGFANEKPKADYEWLRVYSTEEREFPDDFVVLEEKIVASIFYRGWVSIEGPRILELNLEGKILNYSRVVYSLQQKELLKIPYLFKEKDGFLMIGLL
ncbi:MAG: hypothetical protein N3D74_05230, partial [Caldisericia bacterium]|nr:hypothetical protein [Caldisericia bacterium]